MKAYSLFTPSITFFMILILLIMTTKSQNLIDSTCRASSRNDPNIDYDFCKTVLQSSPATRSCSTLNGLGKILITLVLNNLTDTRSYIERITKDTRSYIEPYVRQCLDDCLELYSDGIAYADQATSYYDASEFEDANVAMSSIIDDVTTCEDGFEEREGSVSPLNERNSDESRLSTLALSVMSLVRIGVPLQFELSITYAQTNKFHRIDLRQISRSIFRGDPDLHVVKQLHRIRV
ncbi:Unknown protein [Striga hermonthica]|uniref:Pectinesterase inhibitor domain-containing protein n=1 Tax=Striga hermonthica TaxID=68872 RepID=A0A9N7RQZ6_STRHE|nr:Unknown protein [Striga hermonthica]